MKLTKQQEQLLNSLDLPLEWDGLSDDELIEFEDKLSDELQLRGINKVGDGLNDYGELCLELIKLLPDD